MSRIHKRRNHMAAFKKEVVLATFKEEKIIQQIAAEYENHPDQGSQYPSRECQSRIRGHGVQISLDERGRWQDNARMERFWRRLKHECYLFHDFESMEEAAEVCGEWIKYYSEERPHQELGNLSPGEWLAE